MQRRSFLTSASVSLGAVALPLAAKAKGADPMIAVFEEWLEARRTWLALANLPGNENWDDPRSLEASKREYCAENRMLELTPTSLEGIAALAVLAWQYVCPASTDPEEFAVEAAQNECRALIAIWRACSGREGYPTT